MKAKGRHNFRVEKYEAHQKKGEKTGEELNLWLLNDGADKGAVSGAEQHAIPEAEHLDYKKQLEKAEAVQRTMIAIVKARCQKIKALGWQEWNRRAAEGKNQAAKEKAAQQNEILEELLADQPDDEDIGYAEIGVWSDEEIATADMGTIENTRCRSWPTSAPWENAVF